MFTACVVCGKKIKIEELPDKLCSDNCRKKAPEKPEKAPFPKEFCMVCGEPSVHIKLLQGLRFPACKNSSCEKTALQEYYKVLMRRVRLNANNDVCEVKGCGFKLTRVRVYGSKEKKPYRLCPNHHALLETRMETLKDLGLQSP